ncbi:MAG: formate/nitrite transporter family protein [Planctomycetes bacterium]|nr:formate/nitrite transporter family protein [Planctomycetota bacterium]
MDYVKPAQVVESLASAGEMKSKLPVRHLLLRGALSGAFLGFATSLAITASIQTGIPLVGAIVFPVGFVMIVLFGLELVTGNFAVLTIANLCGRATGKGVWRNWAWVFLGNLLGSLFYAGLLFVVLTSAGAVEPNALGQKVIAIAEAKTLGYKSLGTQGLFTMFAKGMLCNWMVCMGVLMSVTAKSVTGKIVAAWLPITTFFAQGFEHSVVNMFVIPTGMMMGAKVTVADWWLWNQVPVTLANLVSGALFVGAMFHATYSEKRASEAVATVEEFIPRLIDHDELEQPVVT